MSRTRLSSEDRSRLVRQLLSRCRPRFEGAFPGFSRVIPLVTLVSIGSSVVYVSDSFVAFSNHDAGEFIGASGLAGAYDLLNGPRSCTQDGFRDFLSQMNRFPSSSPTLPTNVCDLPVHHVLLYRKHVLKPFWLSVIIVTLRLWPPDVPVDLCPARSLDSSTSTSGILVTLAIHQNQQPLELPPWLGRVPAIHHTGGSSLTPNAGEDGGNVMTQPTPSPIIPPLYFTTTTTNTAKAVHRRDTHAPPPSSPSATVSLASVQPPSLPDRSTHSMKKQPRATITSKQSLVDDANSSSTRVKRRPSSVGVVDGSSSPPLAKVPRHARASHVASRNDNGHGKDDSPPHLPSHPSTFRPPLRDGVAGDGGESGVDGVKDSSDRVGVIPRLPTSNSSSSSSSSCKRPPHMMLDDAHSGASYGGHVGSAHPLVRRRDVSKRRDSFSAPRLSQTASFIVPFGYQPVRLWPVQLFAGWLFSIKGLPMAWSLCALQKAITGRSFLKWSPSAMLGHLGGASSSQRALFYAEALNLLLTDREARRHSMERLQLTQETFITKSLAGLEKVHTNVHGEIDVDVLVVLYQRALAACEGSDANVECGKE